MYSGSVKVGDPTQDLLNHLPCGCRCCPEQSIRSAENPIMSSTPSRRMFPSVAFETVTCIVAFETVMQCCLWNGYMHCSLEKVMQCCLWNSYMHCCLWNSYVVLPLKLSSDAAFETITVLPLEQLRCYLWNSSSITFEKTGSVAAWNSCSVTFKTVPLLI